MMDDLDSLCERHGVATSYYDMTGALRIVPTATKRAVLAALGVDVAGATHESNSGTRRGRAPPVPARAPAQCFVPAFLKDGRVWGIALQLYQLRSARSAGIGDFRDLHGAVEAAARAGADFVGVNPLHALFSAAPERCSPFSPSNRRYLNPLSIAVDEAPGFHPQDLALEDRDAVNAPGLVDYPAVSEVKLSALRAAWRRWRDGDGEDADHGAFRAFRAARGETLAGHATFEALSEHFAAQGVGVGWPAWPHEFHDPEGDAVREFARQHAAAIEFHAYLQWVADRQLAEVTDTARKCGMRIGLYLDLAVGESPDGSAAWSNQGLVARGLRVGAPPDFFNMKGQDWGLAPLSPLALAADGYQAYQAMLADVVRHGGALRLDHVMGLLRTFCIPPDATALDGTYLYYPIESAISAVAAASHECSTVVIGEDLGTVPDGLRELLADAEIHAYRVLYFEHHNGRLAPPEAYPARALACLSTHDLPTLDGWWHGSDIDLRVDKGLITKEEAARERGERRHDLATLIDDLAASGRLGTGRPAERTPPLDDDLAVAVHRHLAATPSRLCAVRLEDLAGETDPVNVPGVMDYPNWQRRFALTIEELERTPRYRAIVAAVAAERPRD